MEVLHICTDNTIKAVEIDGSLKSFQELVGGYIEVIPFVKPIRFGVQKGEKVCMIANEEGIIMDLPRNRIASHMTYGADIYGDVVLCGTACEEFVELKCTPAVQLKLTERYCPKKKVVK